jgi:putative membrane protein
MFDHLSAFLIHWGILVVALWLSSRIFSGLRFDTQGALLVSALLLGFVNAFVKPLVILLTLPLTVLTLGLFLLVINALMIRLVAVLVGGFRISGFWTAFFASMFISLFSFVANYFFSGGDVAFEPVAGSGLWV